MSDVQYWAAGGGSGGGRPRRTGWRRLVPSWRVVTGTVLAVLVLLLGGFFLGYALVSIPDPNAAAVAQSNVYYYADGKTENYIINVGDLMKGASSEPWLLRKGDVILVPEKLF